MKEPKEIDVFNRFDRFGKLKVIGIAILIAIVSFTALYFFTKSLFEYTVTYELNGGYVYNQTLEPTKVRFLQRISEPQNVKKEGYYLDYWSKDKNLSTKYVFGSAIWRSMTLYVKWEEGVAVRLHFADGEENSDMSTADLKGYYEQYLKPGSDWSIPLVFNQKENSLHKGEQLLWYDNPECTGDPFAEKSYTNLTENVDIYGRWFDTDSSKFQVDENGTLQKYLGHCNKVIMPSGILKIKDIPEDKFNTGESDSLNDQPGTYQSAWQNVMDDPTGVNGLKIIYLNSELIEIGDCAFRDCVGLQKVVFLGPNVEILGKWAFGNCYNLAEFTIPTKVTEIPSNCFNGAFNRNKNVSLKLGDNVLKIHDKAFINSKLGSVEITKANFIGANAFASCHNLKDFVIKTNTVITSNVVDNNNDNVPNPNGIFFDTYSYAAVAQHLKIHVPEQLYNSFMALKYWSMYSNVITKIESN